MKTVDFPDPGCPVRKIFPGIKSRLRTHTKIGSEYAQVARASFLSFSLVGVDVIGLVLLGMVNVAVWGFFWFLSP
jgi:hypothetical protein